MTTRGHNEKCYYCGGVEFEARRVRYIYSREGKNLYVPDMPAEVCLGCGMIYYDGPALLKVEERFNAIYRDHEKPDRYTTMPVYEYA
jgi:YgiT-type zinc finger domain-containing protein